MYVSYIPEVPEENILPPRKSSSSLFWFCLSQEEMLDLF